MARSEVSVRFCGCGCGVSFPPKRIDQRYIDDRHRNRAWERTAKGKASVGQRNARYYAKKGAGVAKRRYRRWGGDWHAARKDAERQKHKRRRAYINSFKTHCINCEGHFPPRQLDFHHRDRKIKHFTIGGTAGLKCSKAALDAEIAKCDVLCKVCHRNEHELERLKAKDPDRLDLTVEYSVKKRPATLD